MRAARSLTVSRSIGDVDPPADPQATPGCRPPSGHVTSDAWGEATPPQHGKKK